MPPSTIPRLTIAVIARDEEGTLPSLFESLAGLPESRQIILVDTGSLDGTRNLSSRHGAEVHDFAWNDDFSAARNHALSLSRGDWILWLDADDELPPSTSGWLSAQLDTLSPDQAYAFQIRSPGPGGTLTTSTQIRLFPNHRGLRFRNPVHENIGESIQEQGLDVRFSGLEILHTGYCDQASVDRKKRRNRALLEKAMAPTPVGEPAPSLCLAWAKMLMSEGQWSQAEESLRRVLAQCARTSPEVLAASRICLGQCLGFQNRPDEALSVFTAAADEYRHHAPFLLEYGKALWITGHAARARAVWNDCLTAGQEFGTVPTDWDSVLGGARRLLDETAPKPPSIPARQPSRPQDPVANRRGDDRRLDLSVCSIFKDEAENLPDLIACLPLSRIEWIVLDTGSRDATVEIVRKAGVEPRSFAWTDDFAAARNASLALAKRGWILWLDGDDRLDEGFWDAIIPLLEGPKQAYRFIVRSPREGSHGERFRQIRLFPNHLGITFEGRIHEQLGTSLQKLGLTALQADLEILHVGYDTEAKRNAKLLRNRALLERERQEHPQDPTVILEYGNCLYQSGEFPAAKAAYLTLVPPDAANVRGAGPADEILRHYPALIGETCLRLGETEAAHAWYTLATHWNPTDIHPFYWLGKQALAVRNVHGALEYFYAAIDRPALVGKVATDSHTVRRNALALVFLCETQLFGNDRAPRAQKCLRELMEGGLNPFPLQYRVPWDFWISIGAHQDAERYARTYLGLFPKDMSMWEDFLEYLFAAGRQRDVQAIFTARPDLADSTGVLEAFHAKSLEAAEANIEKIYAVYRQALRKFPEDPTLLVYFSDFVNHNGLYARCYADLKALPGSSEPVREFLRQLEAQGLGREGDP